MVKTTLLFQHIQELIDFGDVTKSVRGIIDQDALTLTFDLSDAEIELAVYGY